MTTTPTPKAPMNKVWLTVFLASPVLVVAVLLWAINGSINSGTKLAGPPVGAGAGHTGMANEYIGIGHREHTDSQNPDSTPPEGASAQNTPAETTQGADHSPAGNDDVLGNATREPSTTPAGTNPAPETPIAATPEAPAVEPQTLPGAQPASANLVRPEALPQGFVLVVDDVTRQASDAEPIYLASSWNGWDPKDATHRLERRSDGKWQIVLTPPEADAASIAFKFTMGGWDREEVNSSGEAVSNRLLDPVDASRLSPGERPVIELQIIRFRTTAEARAPKTEIERPIEATGTVVRLELVGGAGRAAGTVRNAQVWLPPGYNDPANADRRYPVLYMTDGQNLFQTPPGGFGEWHADETATRLIEEGKVEPLIIVGIPHAGMYRADEYLPFSWLPNADASGQAFEQWLLTSVKPRVERAFRTADGPENTGIGGSSLGGVISLYIATRHPEIFGRLLAESVSSMGGPLGEFSMYINSVERWPTKVFLGMGGNEARDIAPTGNAQYVEWAESIERRALATRNAPEVRCRIVPDAAHNEDAWAARLPEALEFLFPKR